MLDMRLSICNCIAEDYWQVTVFHRMCSAGYGDAAQGSKIKLPPYVQVAMGTFAPVRRKGGS